MANIEKLKEMRDELEKKYGYVGSFGKELLDALLEQSKEKLSICNHPTCSESFIGKPHTKKDCANSIECCHDKEKWEPKEGAEYFFVSDCGNIGNYPWFKDRCDVEHMSFGNCFHTKKEAVQARDKIKELLTK